MIYTVMTNIPLVRSVGTRKRASQLAVRRNVSLPPALDCNADFIIAKLGFSGLSDYLQSKLRQDQEALLAA